MDLDQLNGRCQRLKGELARAYAQEPWPTGQIDRLIEEISGAEAAIAAIHAEARATTADGAGVDRFAPASASPASTGKSTTRTPSVARNRLTPFGAPAPHSAGE